MKQFWIKEERMKYLILIFLLTGCEDCKKSVSIEDYSCDKTQMEKVESEALFCVKNTSYLTTICYLSAMARNCPKRIIETKK